MANPEGGWKPPAEGGYTPKKSDRELPYVFDLMYDIKTKDQLITELSRAEAKVKQLKKYIKEHNIIL